MQKPVIQPFFLTRREVEIITSLSRSSIYERAKEGTFPWPVRIGRRGVAWRRSDIEEWLANPSGYRAAA